MATNAIKRLKQLPSWFWQRSTYGKHHIIFREWTPWKLALDIEIWHLNLTLDSSLLRSNIWHFILCIELNERSIGARCKYTHTILNTILNTVFSATVFSFLPFGIHCTYSWWFGRWIFKRELNALVQIINLHTELYIKLHCSMYTAENDIHHPMRN